MIKRLYVHTGMMGGLMEQIRGNSGGNIDLSSEIPDMREEVKLN